MNKNSNIERKPISYYIDIIKNDLLAMLIMVKNEEKSIELTIKSVKNHIKHIIVFDTGSTDNTINIMKETCKKYNMILHLKIGQFKSFPESRNEALEFAETINIKNLILMDAGDEFNCYLNPDELYYCLRLNYKKLGIVKQQWIYNDKCEEHTDIRFVKNKENMRYDILYPVHEKIKDAEENVCDFSNIICLYQNRDLYGEKTKARYIQDIELLLNAQPNKRNLYFLAQSYMSIDDYRNGFKYNVLSTEQNDNDNSNNKLYQSDLKSNESDLNYKNNINKTYTFSDFNESITYVRIGYCAIKCDMSESIIMKYLNKAISCSKDPPIDPYIYILKYSIENNKDYGLKYIDEIMNLKHSKTTMINHHFYNYIRWHLISILCLKTSKELEKGYECIKKIIHYKENNDINNIKIYKALLNNSDEYDNLA
jgi:hypothetical protein